MSIPSTGSVSLSTVRNENGSGPYNLGSYYLGGSYVRNGIYGGSVPSSGPISLGAFRGTDSHHNYVSVATPVQSYQASTGWSIDYFNGHLVATLATCSNLEHATPYADALQFATSTSLLSYYGGWDQVAQVFLDVPNTVYYGTNANCIKLGGSMPGGNNPNAYSPTGWCMAASWDGANAITIYCQPSMNGTGDNGSTITLSNLITSFGTISGTHFAGNDKNGNPTYAANATYTFNFR